MILLLFFMMYLMLSWCVLEHCNLYYIHGFCLMKCRLMTFYQLYLKFRFILLKLISVIESMLSLILRQIQQFFLFFVFGGDGNE